MIEASPTRGAMTDADVLHIQRDGARTVLTLNRPDKANSLAAVLVNALHDAIRTASADGTALLVVRGNGRNFCGGFDLASVESQTDATLVPQLMALERMLQALYYAPIPTVALIHGGVFGAGFDLAMACDYRLAAAGSATLQVTALVTGPGTRTNTAEISAGSAAPCICLISAAARVFRPGRASRPNPAATSVRAKRCSSLRK